MAVYPLGFMPGVRANLPTWANRFNDVEAGTLRFVLELATLHDVMENSCTHRSNIPSIGLGGIHIASVFGDSPTGLAVTNKYGLSVGASSESERGDHRRHLSV